jgi:hypothetical protein
MIVINKFQKLLGTPINRLPLDNVDNRLSYYKKKLMAELKLKSIHFDFHLWVSDEWFCPDGVPGFALPFYLFNKKLMAIQKQQMGYIEGSSEKRILMLMRHELGHAIDNAFALRRNKQRQFIFGSSKLAYPDSYSPQKYSTQFVKYLGEGYAQSHPDEDFAETFAYWLDPQKKWQSKKLSKIVKMKLEFMDGLIKSLEGKQPVLRNKFNIDSVYKNKLTLKNYYSQIQKQKKYNAFDKIDKILMDTFEQRSKKNNKTSSQLKFKVNQNFLKNRINISQLSNQDSKLHQYELHRALQKIAERVQRLGLKPNKEVFLKKSPSIINSNYRYLKENHLLKYYL